MNRKLPHLGDKGRGVNRKLPHLGNKGRGVNRQLPHLGDKGQGVNRKTAREEWLAEWLGKLQDRFFDARIACGDWERICSVGTMTRFGFAGVLLDPPYGTTGAVYACDSTSIAQDVQNWCLGHGQNPMLRIALCGHVGQHEILEANGWAAAVPSGKGGGYQGKDDRERIWFSPHCKNTAEKSQLSLFD